MTLRANLVPILRIERLARFRPRRCLAQGLGHAARSRPQCDPALQHRRERIEYLAHLRRLVGKDIRRIHVVHDRGIVGLEDQQRAVSGLRTVHGEIIEADAFRHAGKRRLMPAAEADVERAHEGLFLQALGRAVRHSGVEIPDVPAVGDRHVAGVRLAVDEDDPVFAEQAVLARIVDKSRDEELLFFAPFEIARHRRAVVDLGETDTGVRSARPHDDGKGKFGRDAGERFVRFRG